MPCKNNRRPGGYRTATAESNKINSYGNGTWSLAQHGALGWMQNARVPA